MSHERLSQAWLSEITPKPVQKSDPAPGVHLVRDWVHVLHHRWHVREQFTKHNFKNRRKMRLDKKRVSNSTQRRATFHDRDRTAYPSLQDMGRRRAKMRASSWGPLVCNRIAKFSEAKAPYTVTEDGQVPRETLARKGALGP